MREQHENRRYKEFLLINGRYFSGGETFSVAQDSAATILLRNPDGSADLTIEEYSINV